MTEKIEDALKYINPEDLGNYNLKKAEKLMKEAATEGFYIAQVYMAVFSCNNQNEVACKKWIDEVRKVDPKFAEELSIMCFDVGSDEWNRSIEKLKSVPGRFSDYYRLEYLLKQCK